MATDGDLNVGITSEDELEELKKDPENKAAQKGIESLNTKIGVLGE